MAAKVEHPARVGDLVLARRTRTVWYQDRIEKATRWYLFRIESVDRRGRVKTIREPGPYHGNPVATVDGTIYVASKDMLDVDAALESFEKERPEGFDSLDEAREFLRRFLIEASAKEG